MSWLYSRVLVEDCLAQRHVGCGQCAPSNWTGIVDAFLFSDKTSEPFQPSRYGMTFAPLMEPLGKAESVLLQAGSHVNLSVAPVGEGE
jgi:hypothetical protein